MEMRMLKKSVYAGVLLILAVSFGGATSLSDAYQDGVTAARNGQFNVAVAKLRGLAENGDTQAQYALGYSYERGFGVPQDYAQSARWYRLAADKKHYWARINLGLLLARGRGLPQDKSKAKEWINLAAEQSGPKERYEIGLLFSGLDPVFDAALAFRWLHDAALHLQEDGFLAMVRPAEKRPQIEELDRPTWTIFGMSSPVKPAGSTKNS